MAKKTKLTGKGLDAYYADLIEQKVAAGLPKLDAQEVVARQRKEDEANKVEIFAEEPAKDSDK